MTKIKNKGAYPAKIPIATDCVIGSDSENDGKTVNFQFDSFVDFINSINGTEVISYIFRTSPIQELDQNGYGYFLSESNIVEPQNVTKLIISKKTKSLVDLTPLFNFIDGHSDTFSLKLRNMSDPNNFIYFDILGIIEEDFQFTFSVEITDSDNFLGDLEVDSIYGLDFNNAISISSTDDLPEGTVNLYFTTARVLSTILTGVSFITGGSISASDTILSAFGKIQKQISDLDTSINLKLDKGSYAGTAQTLKTDIDNIYQPDVLISSIPPTRTGNTFTYPALQYEALISKTVRTNPTQFITTIDVAATDYKRVDLIWFKSDNTLVKTIGTESLTVAQRPDIPIGQVGVPVSFINVFANVVNDPVPVTKEISIQDAQGLERFRIDTYIRYKGFTFDAPNKLIAADALTPFTVYIDTVNGNDSTGQVENKSKPYKTDAAAYSALPFDDGTEWTLLYIDNNVTRTMTQMPNRSIKIQCQGTGTFSYTNVGFVTLALSKFITFDVKKCNIIYNNTLASRFSDLGGHTVVINCTNFTINAPIQGTTGFFNNVTMDFKSTLFTNTQGGQIFGCNGVVNIAELRTADGVILANGVSTELNANISKITKTGTGTLAFMSVGGTAIINLNVKEVRGSGIFNFKTTGSATINVNFSNFDCDAAITLVGVAQNGTGINRFSGTSSLTRTINFSNGTVVRTIIFENFIGRISAITSMETTTLSMNNSAIKVANIFASGTSISSAIFNGSNSIIFDTPAFLFGSITTPSTFEINGTLKTNVTSYGVNVSAIDLGLTFKEKAKEVVIRNKADLINKVLMSNMTYIIDGTISILTGEYIQVPVGGLTIAGYGFDVSKINKNVAGESIFTSPAGNSGNFVSRDVEYNPGLGSVFNITDSNGTHAIELNDVNFQGVTGSSLGIFNGYRQFTGTTCGFYNLSDGLILEGNWSGFKLTNSNVIGFASAGTLFKKGTATVFSNRFSIDLNIQISTESKICDFAPANLTNDKSLQVVNCYTKVNGVIDDATTSITFPNITPYSSKAYFVNNIGIKNSNNMPYGINTGNMQTYANDSAAASGGIVVIGDTYIETSTGYFKKRLT